MAAGEGLSPDLPDRPAPIAAGTAKVGKFALVYVPMLEDDNADPLFREAKDLRKAAYDTMAANDELIDEIHAIDRELPRRYRDIIDDKHDPAPLGGKAIFGAYGDVRRRRRR